MLSAQSTPAAAVALMLGRGLPLGLAFPHLDICMYCSDRLKLLSLRKHASASAACVFVASDTKFADILHPAGDQRNSTAGSSITAGEAAGAGPAWPPRHPYPTAPPAPWLGCCHSGKPCCVVLPWRPCLFCCQVAPIDLSMHGIVSMQHLALALPYMCVCAASELRRCQRWFTASTNTCEGKTLCTLIRQALGVHFKTSIFLHATSPVAAACLLPRKASQSLPTSQSGTAD